MLVGCTTDRDSVVGVDELAELRLRTLPRDTVLTTVVAETSVVIPRASLGLSSRVPVALDAPGPGGFRARALYRFLNLPQDTVSIQRARLRMPFDRTSGEEIAISVHRVLREWSSVEATWTEAKPGEVWSDPGGDFAPEPLAETTLVPAETDTQEIRLDVPAEIVQGWQTGSLENFGLLVQTSTPGTFVELLASGAFPRGTVLELEVTAEDGLDTLAVNASADTGIFDVTVPPTDGALRVGAIPPSRTLLQFGLPSLPAGTTINSAKLRIAVADDRLLPAPLRLSVHQVASPWLGSKTILAPGVADMTSVSIGDMEVVLNVTGLVSAWLENPQSNRGLALRATQERQSLGLVDLQGSSGDGQPPIIELVFTLPVPPPEPGSR